jgi:transposase
MWIVGLPKSFYYVSHHRPIEIRHKAHQQLQWLNTWLRLHAEGFSIKKAADILKLPRSTLYRWQKRLDKRGLRGLDDGDQRPKQVRRSQWSPELAEAVQCLREAYPGTEKEKQWKLLRREGAHTSISTVGRILKRLKARGVLREPPLEMGSAGENAAWCAPTLHGSQRSTGRRNQVILYRWIRWMCVRCPTYISSNLQPGT